MRAVVFDVVANRVNVEYDVCVEYACGINAVDDLARKDVRDVDGLQAYQRIGIGVDQVARGDVGAGRLNVAVLMVCEAS